MGRCKPRDLWAECSAWYHEVYVNKKGGPAIIAEGERLLVLVRKKYEDESRELQNLLNEWHGEVESLEHTLADLTNDPERDPWRCGYAKAQCKLMIDRKTGRKRVVWPY